MRPSALLLALIVVCTVLLGACSAPAPKPGPLPRFTAPTRHKGDVGPNDILFRAIALVGTPYRYGGNTPDGGFDCSGLVNYVYRDMLDLRLPRTAHELAGWQGPRIPLDHLVAADLVFFGDRGLVSHVGIYVGEGRFVHAPSTGGTVRLDRLDGAYWRDHYTGATRVLR